MNSSESSNGTFTFNTFKALNFYTMPTIHQTLVDNHILLLEIDNPPANSLAKVIKEQLATILPVIRQHTTLRCLIIAGRGKHFCAGDDLKEAMQNTSIEGGIASNLKAFGPMFDQIEALPFPTIAAINGWCIGGGLELALCCDIRLATPTAKFIAAGVNVGLVSSVFRLPKLIGIGRAKRMLLTGQAIDATQAKEFGLLCDITAADSLLQEAIVLAKIIASKAPLAIREAKQLVKQFSAVTNGEETKIWEETILKLAQTEDHQEALNAFVEKRKPRFKGK